MVFENGAATRMFGVLRDITDETEAAAALDERARLAERDRLRAEERARERQRFALALDAGAIGTFEADLVADEIRVNGKLREIWGWPSDIPVRATDADKMIVEEDRAERNAAHARALAGNGRYCIRFRIRRANDGALRWIDTRGQVYFENGAPVRAVGASRDVTDEVEAAAALEERARLAERDRLRAEELARERQRLEMALEAGAIGTYEIDLLRDEAHLSEKHREILGWLSDQPMPLAVFDSLVVEEDLAALLEERARAMIGDGRFRARFRFRRASDGALRHIETHGQTSFDGDAPTRVFGVTRDVTDEMEAAAALEERASLAEQDRLRAEELARERQRLALALEAGAIGAFDADLVRDEIRLATSFGKSGVFRAIW